MKSPSDAQIKFADEIAKVLGIDFPISSKEFTAQCYYYFIRNHIDEYRDSVINETNCWFFEEEMDWYSPLNMDGM